MAIAARVRDLMACHGARYDVVPHAHSSNSIHRATCW